MLLKENKLARLSIETTDGRWYGAIVINSYTYEPSVFLSFSKAKLKLSIKENFNE